MSKSNQRPSASQPIQWFTGMERETGKPFPIHHKQPQHGGILSPAMGAYIKSQLLR